MVAEKVRGFNPAQYEIINMMSCLPDDYDYTELKTLLVKFLDCRLQAQMDKLYASGEITDEKMANLVKRHLRTPYRAH